jgi:hypothetical protein
MRHLKTRTWVGLLGLFAALASGSPARGQSPASSFPGFYVQKDAATGEESLVRLEFFTGAAPHGYVVATILQSDGGYRVLAGRIDLGGLRIPFVALFEARRPYPLLRRPALLLQNLNANLNPAYRCQINLVFSPPNTLQYGCSSQDGSSSSSGSLVRIRQ